MGIDPVSLADKRVANIRRISFPDKASYDRVLNKMVLAFIGQIKGCETEKSTEQHCREVLDVCMSGFRKDGSVWKKAPGLPQDDWYEVLRKRLKVYKYDIDNKRIIAGNTKKTSIKLKEKFTLKSDSSSGSSPKPPHPSELSVSDKVKMEQFKEDFLNDFPIKSSIVDTLMMNRLAFMYVMNEKDYENVDITKFLTEEIIKLSDALGVSGKQRVNQEAKDRQGTIDELIEIYKKTKLEFIDIDKEYKIEELSLISNAVHRGSLPEFVGMSYVRRLYGGEIENKKLNIENLDIWLKKQGVVVNVGD